MTESTKAKKKSWTIACFETPGEKEDLACWLMIQCGSIGAQVEPLPDEVVRIEATFNQSEMTEELLQQIRISLEEYGLGGSLVSLRHKIQEEEDWLSKWKEGFEPFRVGEQLVICPPWSVNEMSAELTSGRRVLILEPGMAFGTGLHATTQYCLRGIEKLSAPNMVLDVGTGSGILAIACKFLFPDCTVIGVDPDPVAIEVAEKNLALNGMSGQIEMLCASTEVVRDQKFDGLLSNLTCEDIVSLLPEYELLLKPGGVVLCAGILQEKLHKLEKALAERGWKILSSQPEGMWCGLTIAHAATQQ